MSKTHEEDVRNICSACGTSPVNHHLIFSLNLIEETVGKINLRLFSFTSKGIWLKFSKLVEKLILNLMSTIGIMRFSDDIKKSVTGRSKLIWEEAKRRNIMMQQIQLLGKPLEFYRAKVNGKMHYFQSLPIPEHLSTKGYLWLDDKFTLFEKLDKAGIPAPHTKKAFTLKGAKKAFDQMQKPLIIKPKNGSRGRHTTTNITTEEEFLKALEIARQITLFPVIQEHLDGSVYRATVITNKLVGFYRADPPFVKGDGTKTIQDLILEKNKTRNERLSDILINNDLRFFIKRYGYELEDILPEGTALSLSAKTGRMYGGYTK
ncbi:MAG: ATP-grasp domain-containing protein, partial [Patescibacteria group bacterium]